MTEIALVSDHQGIEVSATSLTVLETDAPFELISSALNSALSVNESSRWWIGDLIAFAERRWGDDYAQLLDETRLTERQAERYRYVAQQIRPPQRRENLSFSHHEVVAALTPPDQERLLALAAASEMSVARLRDAVRDHKAFEDPEPRRRQTVLPASEVDAARGVRTIRNTLVRLGDGLTPEAREASGISESLSALPDVTKTVKRTTALEPLALAVAAVIAAGVRQTGLPDPAVIVPSGPWDTLVAAYATATDGGA